LRLEQYFVDVGRHVVLPRFYRSLERHLAQKASEIRKARRSLARQRRGIQRLLGVELNSLPRENRTHKAQHKYRSRN
jgi:hypothetical protein